jgi:hypothetical protein
MCDCENVDFGDYDNMIAVRLPWKKDTDERNVAGLDPCIAIEIIRLWNKGIVTKASCCGHNIIDGSIIVPEKFISQMESLGYEKYENSCPGGAFYPLSINKLK